MIHELILYSCKMLIGIVTSVNPICDAIILLVFSWQPVVKQLTFRLLLLSSISQLVGRGGDFVGSFPFWFFI